MGMIENPQLKYRELLLMVYLILAVSVHFLSLVLMMLLPN